MEEIGYWTAKLQSEPVTHNFICAYGYQENVNKLIVLYRHKKTPYKNWRFFGPEVAEPNDLITPKRIVFGQEPRRQRRDMEGSGHE
jgi:hypothetical protein